MDAGNRKEEDHRLGTTQPAPSNPRPRPLRYHNRRPPQQQYYPFGQKLEEPHDHTHTHTHTHTHQREPALPGQTLLDHAPLDLHHPLNTAPAVSAPIVPSALSAPSAPSAPAISSTATATATVASASPGVPPLLSTTFDDDSFESRAANNQNAAHANAITSIEPDGFYRNHIENPMASTLPAPRQSQDALPRSSEVASVSRHPAMSSGRSSARSSTRSVSAPIEDGASSTTAKSRSTASNTRTLRSGHQPSVKDLKKKFDQNATKTTTNVARKTTPNLPTRETQWSESNGSRSHPDASGRRSVARDRSVGPPGASSHGTRSTHNARITPEDNLSSNAQSFANRIANPRNSVSVHSQGSKSMTSLAQTRSTPPVPPLPESRGLPLSDVDHTELNTGLVGDGIDDTVAGRTSESNIHETLSRRQRSFSHTDAEPPSPSDWYRGLSEESEGTGNVVVNRPNSTSPYSRSQSDIGHVKSVREQSTPPRSGRPKPTLDISALTPGSKIPISVRKYSTPSGSTSPDSTRSTSPSTIRRSSAQGRKGTANQKPRPSIPSPLASPPAATKRPRRPSTTTPSASTRLNAYISVPPPKLSPPLRSSRPRQPVSVATTISSRVKAIERDKSPANKDTGTTPSGNDSAAHRKKILMSPIDYESRRERIKLSYTKSLQENEARAATRRAAQNKKRKEDAKALAAQISSTKTPEDQEDASKKLIQEDAQKTVLADTLASEPALEPAPEPAMELPAPQTTTSDPPAEAPVGEAPIPVLPPLQTKLTELVRSEIPTASNGTKKKEISPTLGVPGSFPDSGDQDSAPTSAISNTTEFDAEPQTEPPVQETLVKDSPLESGSKDDHRRPPSPKIDYQSPFDEPGDDNRLSIQIALDTSSLSAVAPVEFSEPVYDNLSTTHEVALAYKEEERVSEPIHGDLSTGQEVSHAYQDEDRVSEPRYDLEASQDTSHEYQEEVHVSKPIYDTISISQEVPQTHQEEEPVSEPVYDIPDARQVLPQTDQEESCVSEHSNGVSSSHEVRQTYQEEVLVSEPGYDDIEASQEAQQTYQEEARVSEPIYDTVSASQEAPHVLQDEMYEPMPSPRPTYETKVTILGPDTSPASPAIEVQALSSSSPVLEQPATESYQEQDSARSALHESNSDSNQSAVELTTPDSGLSEIAKFFVGPSFRRHQEAFQRPDAPQIDTGVEANADVNNVQQDTEDTHISLDSKKTLATRPSLTVPRTSASMNRGSQTTVWTDFSVNSRDSSSGYGPTDQDSRGVGFRWQRGFADSETESILESCQYSRDSLAVSNSPAISPCGTFRETGIYQPRHQLPEIDTGEGFAEAILSRRNSSNSLVVPVLPSHSPPPPPDAGSFRDVADSMSPSEYYDETRPNSYLHNEMDDQSLNSADPMRRDSGYFAPSESASRSADQGSLTASERLRSSFFHAETKPVLAEAMMVDQVIELPAKEKKRLFTRLETIKELIDTETFFIRDMNIVEEIYKGTAEACPKLDDKTIKLIFRNTDKIIQFHSAFLLELKEGVSSVYAPRIHRHVQKDTASSSDGTPSLSAVSPIVPDQPNDDRDRATSLGPIFIRNIEDMKQVHEAFLKNSDHAAKRLIQIQEDPTVQVWLNECNEVARELTRAWNLDSLLIKPMQRITKYPNLIIQLLHETPRDHPDRPSLEAAKAALESAIEEINKTKKNFELVGQIVGRRRKESDVKAGFARAFGKRVDKLQAANNRPAEDAEYLKLHEKFGDDYLRLQVVLRDVEYYTRQITDHVHEFLQYLSSMELVMRLQPSPHPEIESKWVQFNVSMRDIEKVALEQHLSKVRKRVIEPFELVIKSYSNPSLAMKKRSKRRLDYEKYIQLQKSGKKIDKQLTELVEQYEALNEALKKELPKLSALTEQVGNICLGNFVNIQAQWFSIWKENIQLVFGDAPVPSLTDIITTFHRDYKFQEEQMNMIGIVNPASNPRPSHSTSIDDGSKFRMRLGESSPRHRGLSMNSDIAPILPPPDFMKRHSGQFTATSSVASVSSNQFYRDYYTGANGYGRPSSDSPRGPEFAQGPRSIATRPGTGQSHESGAPIRRSVDMHSQSRGHSISTQASPYQAPDNHRFSGIFQSALPMSDAQERPSRPSLVSSRASSHERRPSNGYNVLWLAASLFEFNIETTKHEAGYPYLTYQAGEIFDVIAEKGELWLAKNQDDPNNLVGWLWSKHFAKLADD